MRRRPDAADEELSGLLEAVFHVGRSSRYGLKRRRIFRASALRGRPLTTPLEARTAAEASRRARALRLAGRDAEAEAGFERALHLDPSCADAAAGLWEARWAPGRSPAGIERALALEPRRPVWHLWAGLAALGGAEESRREAARARAFFERALSLSPSALGWAGLALALGRGGRWDEAERAAGRAAALEPRQGWVRRLRGQARLRLGDERGFLADARAETLVDEGLGSFILALPERRPGPRQLAAADRFLAGRPRAAWMLVVRGDCRRCPELNDFAGAVADFEAAARLDPRCAFTWGYLSRALMSQGRAEDALRSIDRGVRLAPACGWLRVWRGELKRRLGRLKEALADLEAGVRLDPDYEMGYAWRGGALRALGRPQAALADLELACALDPQYAWAPAERSLTLRALGRPAEALDALADAVRLDPKHAWCTRPADAPAAEKELTHLLAREPRHAWARAWRGETRLRAGRPAEAAADLARAVALAPELAWPRAWLGTALSRLGKPRGALRCLDAALRRDPRYAPALAERGRVRLELGLARAAHEDFAAAAEAGPLSAWIWQFKGEAALRLRRHADAADAFTRALELERGWRPRAYRALSLLRLGRRDEAASDLSELALSARRLAAEGRAGQALGLLDESLRLHPRAFALLAARAEARLYAGDLAGALRDARAACAGASAEELKAVEALQGLLERARRQAPELFASA